MAAVADGRRQAGSGIARSRARARLNWVSQGQRCGRCRVRRRAERVSRAVRPGRRTVAEGSWWSRSARPDRSARVQRARLWAITCTASQAPLAAKRPDGMWFSPTPYLRSRMAFSNVPPGRLKSRDVAVAVQDKCPPNCSAEMSHRLVAGSGRRPGPRADISTSPVPAAIRCLRHCGCDRGPTRRWIFSVNVSPYRVSMDSQFPGHPSNGHPLKLRLLHRLPSLLLQKGRLPQ